MWDFVIELDESAQQPLFLQITRRLIEAIRSGRLASGDRLPGSRSLASQLSVHRNTVLAAYEELSAQGWITFEEARGTFVSQEIPDHPSQEDATRKPEKPRSLGFPLTASSLGPSKKSLEKGVIELAGGHPDLSELPLQDWARAYRRVLRLYGKRVMDYGDPKGYLPLRQEISKMLSIRRGLHVGEDELLLTRGSQMALYLLAQTLIRPGEIVVVEEYGYQPAWDAFRQAGAHLQPVPVDEDGITLDRLELLLSKQSIRAVYLTPHHQFPTQVILSAGRRLRLLELAQRHQFALIEDDYDHEFHYEARPVLPMASGDEAGVVIYVGTLSKVLAPGLRTGYVFAPSSLIERMTRLRRLIDRQGAQVEEAALFELFEEGLVERHIRKMRRIYKERRDVLANALNDTFAGVLSFSLPQGGMAIWAQVIDGTDVERWQQAALREGVLFMHGGSYIFDQLPRPFLRPGFALHPEEVLLEAVRRMRVAHQSIER